MSATECHPYVVNYLNGLLRRERAAVEACDQALPRIRDEPAVSAVWRIREDHRAAVTALEQEVRCAGGWPDSASGTWGAFARFFEGVARWLGGTAPLRGLLQGEAYGAARYDRIRKEEERLPERVRVVIRDQLLPTTREHVRTLKGLIGIR
jgi:hypothetical protein